MKLRRATEDKVSDRVRFNWGYHDAAWDVQHGCVRCAGLWGQQTPRYVSRQFDPAYYEGYIRGIADAENGTYRGSSDNAWREYRTLAG